MHRKNHLPILAILTTLTVLLAGCSKPAMANDTTPAQDIANEKQLSLATYGGGCFWCVEAVFERIDGVEAVTSGYAGGHVKDPTYKQVTTGTTGHAEVVQLAFDPEKVSYETLLEVFWKAHDPTTLNRQGADVGPQYRSIILYHNDAQREAAEASIKTAQKDFSDPIVTEIVPLDHFYAAEGYHQNFYEQNPNQPYCSFVIAPKIKKLSEFIDTINAREK